MWILKRLEYLYIQKVLQENFDISIFNITSVIRIKFLGNKHFIPRGLAVIVMMCTIANWQYLLQILTKNCFDWKQKILNCNKRMIIWNKIIMLVSTLRLFITHLIFRRIDKIFMAPIKIMDIVFTKTLFCKINHWKFNKIF